MVREIKVTFWWWCFDLILNSFLWEIGGRYNEAMQSSSDLDGAMQSSSDLGFEIGGWQDFPNFDAPAAGTGAASVTGARQKRNRGRAEEPESPKTKMASVG